jgi:hypothetical protein
MANENFVAEAIGNVAAFRLQRERGEPLTWQVLRVSATHDHHFRLVIAHPDRVLDLGINRDLKRVLDALSDETADALRRKLEEAVHDGLRVVPLRHVHESVDFWKDDFWNWMG